MSRRRMMMGGASPAPIGGYTMLQYVECTGAQYIDTGVTVSLNMGIDVNWCVPDTTENEDGYLFGVTDNSSGDTQSLTAMQPSCTQDFGDTDLFGWFCQKPFYSVSYYLPMNVWGELVLNKTSCALKVGGVTEESWTINATTAYSSNLTIALGAYRNNNSYVSGFKGYIGECSFGSAHFAPAKRDSDNKAGFLETTSNIFYPSISGTDFIAGPAIS